MLGIGEAFRGQPADPDWRYSGQIMEHLIAETVQLARNGMEDGTNMPQWLALMVHRDNARAIRFYERCGLELIPGVVRNNGHFVMNVWIGE